MKNLKGVEIFEAGTWNGDSYSSDDLDEMVRAFKDTSEKIKPHVKLGHNEDQFLLRNDGLPAAGWITNIYRQGEKLLADISNIPDKVYQLLENGAYKKISSEIFWGIEMGGKYYDKMLSAIAFLGADMPAVTSLSDILAQYGIKDYDKLITYSERDGHKVKYYNLEKGRDMPTERELELKAKLDAEMAKNKVLEESLVAKDSKIEEVSGELTEVKTKNEENEGQLAQFKKEKEEAKLDAEIEKVEAISPSMKPYIKALIGETKKEYSFEGGNKNTKLEIIDEILKLHESNVSVNYTVNSEKGNDNMDNEVEEMKKYAKDNGLDYDKDFESVYRGYKKNK